MYFLILLRHEDASASFVCYITAMRWCCGASPIAPAGPPTLTAKQRARKKRGGRADRGAAGRALLLGRGGPSQSQRLGAQGGPGRHRAGRRGVAGAARRRGRRAAAVPGPAARRAGDARGDGEVERRVGTLGVLVISYPWWAPPALDPLQLAPPARPCCSLHVTHALLPPLARTGSTPTTRTRTGCSCARSQRC